MPSTFRNMRLPTQISLGALLSIIVIFSILIFSIAKLLEEKLNEIITDHQHTEAKLVANQLESEYFLINKSLTRLTILMEQSLAGRVKEQNGRYTLDDQPISANLATLTSIQNASDTDIVLLENRSGQLQVLTSSNPDIPVGTRVDRTSSDTSKPIKLFINKKPYITKAVPLNGTSSLYVGAFIPLDVVYASMTRRLNEVKFGKQGYVYVTDTGRNKGDILIHPSIRNSNLFDLYPNLREDFDKLYQANSGVTYYTAKIKGTDKKARETKAIFQHVDGWDWVAVIKTYTDEYQEEVMWVVWLVTAICIAGATILTVILWLLVMKNLSALNNIVQGVKEIGSGNLAHRFQNKVSHDSRNETHILQLAVEKMRDDLLGLVHAVQNTSSQLAESANQISQANTRLIDSANESAGASLEVASSIQQVSASTEEVANSSVAVSTQSNAVHDVTEKGYTAVQQVEKTVGNLSDSFERAAQTISDVENSTENIGNVVNVINEIAEQTNLLALNAAIEAARAGEQGRGFAVVADEVRVLAQRTQQSTEEIQEVVSRLQQGSRSAVDIMNNGRDEVTLSVKQASDAGDLLKQIHQSMNLVAEGIANVAASTEEQSVAAVQILGNSEALHRSAETTLTEVQFSQQQSQQISHLTNELTQQLAKFKL